MMDTAWLGTVKITLAIAPLNNAEKPSCRTMLASA
eukprot:CAMPEP_0169426492 /NCGR_PEP_ID=MMETSP1042-20121227/236_1 /TAXON_ID=464988 /ORGANISM="Hemiselmis andersenii, Strain CCMP1180" /LENGTH=34 /DNA_ID= /DNA_START= /DNA_END= /DNA_ORIENTATION=